MLPFYSVSYSLMGVPSDYLEMFYSYLVDENRNKVGEPRKFSYYQSDVGYISEQEFQEKLNAILGTAKEVDLINLERYSKQEITDIIKSNIE